MSAPTKPNPLAAILVYGRPTGSDVPQASWFRAEDKAAVRTAAAAIKYSVIELQNDAERELAAGVHEGVLKGSGRMIVGSVTPETYRRIEEFARKAAASVVPPKAESLAVGATKAASEQNTNMSDPVTPSTVKQDLVNPTDAWDRLQVGSYVVAKYWDSDGEPYGWWLGIIAEIDKNDFVIRWPDEPLKPRLKI